MAHDDVIRRLDAAVDALDPRAPMILAYHAAIERELDIALADKLPNHSLLRGLGFGQKVSVWAATQTGDPNEIRTQTSLLLRMNDLRNAIAHGDKKAVIDANLKALVEPTAWVGDDLSEDAVHFAAGWLFGLVHVH